MNTFNGWENFYVIVGSSAGALIGLQFVVITLVANIPRARANAQAGSAFSTPSVVHFCVVLLLSAAGCVPWNGITIIEALWALVGISGVVYTIIVTRRMKSQTIYQPVFEDWLFHGILPLMAYLILAISAYVIHSDANLALILVGTAVLLLLFIGIHNAWDAVTYHVFTRKQSQEDTGDRH